MKSTDGGLVKETATFATLTGKKAVVLEIRRNKQAQETFMVNIPFNCFMVNLLATWGFSIVMTASETTTQQSFIHFSTQPTKPVQYQVPGTR